MNSDPILVIVAVVWIIALLVGVGAYLWYAVMLAKVFARLGAESWKAWVPILNESEILRLGGQPAWSVVFLYLPIVQIYGLYLKAVAASHITRHLGRGTGTTVLAIVAPPIWATLLAGDARPADPALQERIASSVEPRSGYAFAVSTPQPPNPDPLSTVPAPPAAAPGVPPLAPPLPPPFAPIAPPPPAAAPAAAPPAPVAATPPSPPAPIAPPTPAAAPPSAPVAPAPPPLSPPVPVPPASGAVPPPPPPPQIAPPPRILTPPPSLPAPPVVTPEESVAPPPLLVEPPAPTRLPAPEIDRDEGDNDESDELDRTVVVDRRPVVPWHLIVDDGPTLRLSGSRVVLGRKPVGTVTDAQYLAIPDATRTLSKVHARLDLADGVWTVTDLDATNGVIVVEADGTERLLDPGASAPLTERFVLGKVAMRVAFGDDPTP